MNYPLLSEYIEAIKAAEDNFDKLKQLRPVLDEDGEPIMSSGNFAVVFKMRDEQTGKLHAVKCFLKEQEGRAEAYRLIAEELEFVSSTFLTPIKYFDKELFVDTNASDETEFPVLLMDWVEGVTLDKYIREHIVDEYELALLAYQFSRLAMWLMPQPFAHGDLKPDNILVREDGTLVLVDYDGMYVPAMKGQRARELGSPDFRHPSRTETDFDEHIDDFSLASILLSLKAISLIPGLLDEYGASDRLLFSENDYRNISKSKVMDALKPMMLDAELASLYSLFILAISQNNLSQVSFRLFNLARPERLQYEEEILSTEVTKEDLANAWMDEYGVKYSKNRKRLLWVPSNISHYIIKEGTIMICDEAFNDGPMDGNNHLLSVFIPNTVTHIGNGAFKFCFSLETINIPNSVIYIGNDAFSHCYNINITFPNSVNYIGDGAFCNCRSLSLDVIPKSVSYIGSSAFANCYSLTQIKILGKIRIIKDSSFADCFELNGVQLPSSVTHIEEGAFSECYKLNNINIPETIQCIDDYAFEDCRALLRIILPNSLTHLGNGVFHDCESLMQINIPDSISHINKFVFQDCYSLSNVSIPASVTYIKEAAFQCCGIKHLVFHDSKVDISNNSFENCDSLESIMIPKGSKDYFEKLLPEYKDILVENNGWSESGRRHFTQDEIDAVERTIVVASQYGNSVCFYFKSGGETSIPLSQFSTLTIGDSLDLKTAIIITLSRDGDDDIYRVIE